jgi:hypothetical protein
MKIGFNYYHNNSDTNDRKIAKYIGVTLKEYINIMVNKFRAITKENGIYFQNKQKIKKAINWLESFIISHKLQVK